MLILLLQPLMTNSNKEGSDHAAGGVACPPCILITFSSSQAVSLNDVYCFCALWNDTVFKLLNVLTFFQKVFVFICLWFICLLYI
jgi:hypothetical protein